MRCIISTTVRDDDRYLDEWVNYHLGLGFEHIVMYDHLSLVPVINRWGDKVTVIRKERFDITFPDNFHNETFKNFQSDWCAVLDCDEFIVLFQHQNISHLLENYNDYGGLAINWSVYGSSGHLVRPEGLVMDNYLWRMPNDLKDSSVSLVNTIINSKYFIYSHNPHTCRSQRDIVTEDFEICNSALADSSRTLVRVNHYITRSWEDWLHKMDRANRAGCGHLYSEQGFYNTDNDCTVYDDILKDYGKPKIWESIDNWFNFHNLYTDMVGKFNNAVFVEIGTWKGASAVFMADKIKKSGKNIKFYATDIFEPFYQDGQRWEGVTLAEFKENIKPVKDYITPIKGNSHEVHSQFKDKSCDFVFIDANHEYESVKEDIRLWYPKVKDTGILAGHDYTWGGVGQAVNEFASANNLKIKVIPNTSCWMYV